MRRVSFFAGCCALPGLWWSRLQRRWYVTNKLPWIVAAVVGVVLSGISYAVYSLVAYEADRRSLRCLALNVYFEARGEPRAGQYAVAQVTMNRVASRRYPSTVCAVVYQQNWDPLRGRKVGAFSWTEFDVLPSPRDREWLRAQEIAAEVYFGRRAPELNGALHYHATYVQPSWSVGRKPLAHIGKHLFYR